jgi:adenine deaminase
MEEGSINNSLRLAISEGLDPVSAFTIASYNAAQCYGLKDRGALAPGYLADIVIFEDIKNINIKTVIKSGVAYKEDLKFSKLSCENSVKMNPVTEDNFRIEAKGTQLNTIALIPHSVETKLVKREAIVLNNFVIALRSEDYNKIAVFERHKYTGKSSVCYVEGFGLKNCSIAQSIAHDSHNIIVVGDNDRDMAAAVNTVISIGGGIAFVSKGMVLETLKLSVGGLITAENPYIVRSKIKNFTYLAKKFGVKEDFDALLTLGFLALPVIPEIKITPRGLFHYNKFDFLDLFC